MIHTLELIYSFWKFNIYNFKVSLGRNNTLTTILFSVHKTSHTFSTIISPDVCREESDVIGVANLSPGSNFPSLNLTPYLLAR